MIKTVLIDDESACIDVLRELLKENCKQVQILATGCTVEEGINLIDGLNPDLVFLDIELKDKLSFEILEKVKAQNFHVIFTTAHGKYAMQAIKASCLEYLLKPIDAAELVEAVAKFERQKQISLNHKRIEVLLQNIGSGAAAARKIAIPCNDGYEFVNNTDIMYCEADLKYTKIFTNKNERIVSSRNLGEFEEMLQGEMFFRCHKSFIINLNFIRKFLKADNQVIMTNDKLIDISVRKKDEFLRLFERA